MISSPSGQLDQVVIARRVTRPRYAARGQALILAVMIMFLLVGLGGLFIAMISRALVQTARAEERIKLESIAVAGLRMAQNALQYSTDGADWRPDNSGPDESNPGWVHYGDGFYRVNVTYGPQTVLADDTPSMSNPLERFLKIDVEARYALENPPDIDSDAATKDAYTKGFYTGKRFITRKITALQPIGLTDNLLWVTNASNSPEPVVLGSALLVTDGKDDSTGLTTVDANPRTIADDQLDAHAKTIAPQAYLPLYQGPIRVDGDVQLGNLALYLADKSAADWYADVFKVGRFDQLVVTGKIQPLPGIDSVLARYAKISVQPTDPTQEPTVDKILSGGDLFNAAAYDATLIQTRDNNPLLRRMDAPRLDQDSSFDRYRNLTLGSSTAQDMAKVDQGTVVQGMGLYVYNPTQIQYNGVYDTLYAEWLNEDASKPQPHWENGIYRPQCPDSDEQKGGETEAMAIEMILHDWGQLDENGKVSQLPYIELRRYDGVPFRNAQGEPQTQLQKGDFYYLNVEYPSNGVIFAEGNVVVKGTLPASLCFEGANAPYTPVMDNNVQRPGGWVSDEEISYFQNAANRRYDLTIVSGGTIYIEGNLLSPASRSAGLPSDDPKRILSGSARDSKLALLARDNVCLNPTRLFDVVSYAEKTVSGGETLLHAKPHGATGDLTDRITLQFATAGDANGNLQLLLRHAAELAGTDPYCIFRMQVNGQSFNWDANAADSSKDQFLFCPTQEFKQAYFSSFTPAQWGTELFPGKLRQQVWGGLSGLFNGYGAINTVQFEVAQGTTDYLLSMGGPTYGAGFVVNGADVQVDALIYAQRGSWYVIPGSYYNNDAESTSPWPYPKYREPLDIRVTVNGAIVENRPARQDAQEAMYKHWRGSNLRYFTNGSDTAAYLMDPGNATWDPKKWQWTDRRMGIEYRYDPSLTRPVCYTTTDGLLSYLPRLPKLPVSPTLFSFGTMRGA